MDPQSLMELAQRVEDALTDPPDSIEFMHLKLKMEVAASRLYLTLGWMLRDGRVSLEPSEFGFRIRKTMVSATGAGAVEPIEALLPHRE